MSQPVVLLLGRNEQGRDTTLPLRVAAIGGGRYALTLVNADGSQLDGGGMPLTIEAEVYMLGTNESGHSGNIPLKVFDNGDDTYSLAVANPDGSPIAPPAAGASAPAGLTGAWPMASIPTGRYSGQALAYVSTFGSLYSSSENAAQHQADYAFSRERASYWYQGTGLNVGGASLTVRFPSGQAKNITGFRMVEGYNLGANSRANSIDVDGSTDGSTWTRCHTGDPPDSSASPERGLETFNVKKDLTARWWRFTANGGGGNGWEVNILDLFTGAAVAAGEPALLVPDQETGLMALQYINGTLLPAPIGSFSGNGVPPAGLGIDGDYYFRRDAPGTANQRVYIKSAGAWSGIL